MFASGAQNKRQLAPLSVSLLPLLLCTGDGLQLHLPPQTRSQPGSGQGDRALNKDTAPLLHF